MNKNILKKLALIVMGASLMSSAMAVPQLSEEGNCFVLGIHEPGTNIYDGPTMCSELTLSYLTVRGPLELDKTKVNGLTRVSGPLKANGVVLKNVEVENNLTSEIVTLQSGSTVNGNITFTDKEGVVYLESGSTIQGKVINGRIIEQAKK